MAVDDAEELLVIISDPAGWWYQPAGRHAKLETTISFCEWVAAMWLSDDLSYWTARGVASDDVVGLGGARRHSDRTWNLSYRIAASHQGQGLATELSIAAHHAAETVDPSVAFIAWVDERNAASRRVAERIGLTNQRPRADPSNGEIRLATATDGSLDGLQRAPLHPRARTPGGPLDTRGPLPLPTTRASRRSSRR